MKLRIRERWKPISGLEYRYQVSDWGRVRNIETGKMLKPIKQKKGYCVVGLYDGRGNSIMYYIHALVLTMFSGVCPVGMESRHLNGRKGDNRLVNLRWGTKRQNTDDRFRHGRWGRKLKAFDAMKIRAVYSMRPTPQTARMLADHFGVGTGTIMDVVTGQTWGFDEIAYLQEFARTRPKMRAEARDAVVRELRTFPELYEDADEGETLERFDRMFPPTAVH